MEFSTIPANKPTVTPVVEPINFVFKNEDFDCGVSNLVGKLNEDKYSICTIDNITAFGVYDGHGGTFGSQLCSDKFLQSVINEEKKKKSSFSSITTVAIQSDIADALMCESIRKITKSISREIKMRSITGTTCNALFFKKSPDGSYRVYCSNTGDSRCIVQRKKDRSSKLYHMIMSEDHSLNLQREIDRINQRKSVEWKSLPASEHREIETSTGWKIQSVYPSHVRMSRALTLLTMLNSFTEKDKKKSHKNGTTTVTTTPTSTPADKELFISLVETMMEEDLDMSISDPYGLPTAPNDERRESVQELSIKEMLEVTVHGIEKNMSKEMDKILYEIDSDDENEVDDSQFITAPLVHQDSFIGKF